MSEHEGTSLEYVTDGCLRGFTDAEVEQMAEMTLAGRRPLNWNVLTIDSKEPQRYHEQLAACENARAKGGTVVALTMPILVEMNMSFRNYCALFMMPGWSEVMNLPVPGAHREAARSRSPRWMNERATSPEAGVFARLGSWGRYMIGDTFSDANEGLKGRIVEDLAREAGKSEFDTLVDIVINDDLRTVLWPLPSDSDTESWKMRAEAWDHPLVMIGGSDAGAHLDRMCGAPYPTKFLGDCIRGRKLVSLERCVQLMTQIPAELFGLRDRGLVREGYFADLFVFDPETVDTGEVRLVDDLPGGTSPPLRRLGRRAPRDRERHHDRRGRRRHRCPAGHRAAFRPRHLHRADPRRRLIRERARRNVRRAPSSTSTRDEDRSAAEY